MAIDILPHTVRFAQSRSAVFYQFQTYALLVYVIIKTKYLTCKVFSAKILYIKLISRVCEKHIATDATRQCENYKMASSKNEKV